MPKEVPETIVGGDGHGSHADCDPDEAVGDLSGADGENCWICGEPLSEGSPPRELVVCEHINQKFHGDSTSCLDCGAYVEDDDSYMEREEEPL